MDNKYILCIPNSCGFNDVMCQIYVAYMFSKKTNRKLIIDTRLSGLADDLSNYMELNDPNTNIELNLNEKSIEYLNTLSCFPKELTGKIDTIYPVFKSVGKNIEFLYKFTYIKGINLHRYISFKYLFNRLIVGIKRSTRGKYFKKLYKNSNIELLENKNESLLVFHRSGGGEASIEALKLFKFKENISKVLFDKLNKLGNDYDAVHIRNTDYRSNYIDFLKKNQNKLIQRTVLVCSDNFNVVESAKEILKDSNIISFNKFYNLDINSNISYPIHRQWFLSENQIFENNINTLCDLIGISKSNNYYYTSINNSTVLVSGFSKLGENLKNNKELVNSLLGLDKIK